MRILALNVTHDSSVCSLLDGKLEFYSKEERLSRKKRDKHPFKSLELFKSQNFGKVDVALYLTPTNILDSSSSYFMYHEYMKKVFDAELINFSALTHHECHAMLAFTNSGFDSALVAVVDRNGSLVFDRNQPLAREAETVFRLNKKSDNFISALQKNFWIFGNVDKHKIDQKLKEIYKTTKINANSNLSIVKVYEAATTLIGQDILENGKTMGLSSYGEPDHTLPKIFQGDHILSDYFTETKKGEVRFRGLEETSQKDLKYWNYKFFADRAKHVQNETQEALLSLIKNNVAVTGNKNVCLVGGYALNILANKYLIENLPDVNFYFEPNADDSGISIGAAMLYYKQQTGNFSESLKDTFYQYYVDEPHIDGIETSYDEIADMLRRDKSVALFEGFPEAGPRALGHRSILFNAQSKDGKEKVNKIKNREWYRPFAGVMLREYFGEYFNTLGLEKSETMTVAFDCKKPEAIPAIVHVDNTCRIQTVDSGTLFNILQSFYNITGCPVLLNTSFNLAGEPLVHTKQDALNVLNSSCLDAVVFVEDQKLIMVKK